jgi:CO dehydrogenase nickel-insertion accessory protein CooC1
MKISVCGKGGSGKSTIVALLAKGVAVQEIKDILDRILAKIGLPAPG